MRVENLRYVLLGTVPTSPIELRKFKCLVTVRWRHFLQVILGVTLLAAAANVQAASTGKTADSTRLAQATMDFIAHEQAAAAADHRAQSQPQSVQATTPAPRLQPGVRPRNDTQQPKRDWELVPPHQGSASGPVPARGPVSRPTSRPALRPTPQHGIKDPWQDAMTTTPRSRVYHVPIAVEGRDPTTPRYPGQTQTTTDSSWYDKLFGKATDADDSPWGRRRRRQAPEAVPKAQPGAEKSEVVIGSNAIRVGATRRAQTQPRPSGQ